MQARQVRDPTGRVREELGRARTLNAALAALSMADIPMLREIEGDYTFRPGPVDTLRDRIAAAHLVRLHGAAGAKMNDTGTDSVTVELVRRWAHDCMHEWLKGYTDFDEACGGQYRIRPVRGHHPAADAEDRGDVTIEVATTTGLAGRHFQIHLQVTEVD